MRTLDFYRSLNLIATLAGILILGLSELLYRVDETTAMALVQGIGLSLAGACIAAYFIAEEIQPVAHHTLYPA